MHCLGRAIVALLFGAALIGHACAAEQSAWQIGPFERPGQSGINPVIRPDPEAAFDCPMRGASLRWESLHAFNPAAVVHEGNVFLFYRAEDGSGAMRIGGHTSRIGLATSDDGLHFVRQAKPVLFPADDDQKSNEWDGGCEDPRVIRAPDGSFVMTYTQWNHKLPCMAAATSRDLLHWTKRGPVFADGSPMRSVATKSGAIVGRLSPDDGVLTAEMINGTFWMYWGEGDIKLAKSKDLIRWDVVDEAPGAPLLMLPKRPHHFDSGLAEAGPPAVVTDRGIVLLYNGKNSATGGDTDLPAETYATGEALFDAHDPTKLLARVEHPIFTPTEDFERTGQYVAGTTFTEGLVLFKSHWFIYYGCADSFVGVAESAKVGAAPRPASSP